MKTNMNGRESLTKMKNIHLYVIVYIFYGMSHLLRVVERMEMQEENIIFTINRKQIKLK